MERLPRPRTCTEYLSLGQEPVSVIKIYWCDGTTCSCSSLMSDLVVPNQGSGRLCKLASQQNDATASKRVEGQVGSHCAVERCTEVMSSCAGGLEQVFTQRSVE